MSKKSVNNLITNFFHKYHNYMIDKNEIHNMKFTISINDKYNSLFRRESNNNDTRINFILILSYIDDFTRQNFFKFFKAYLFKIYNVSLNINNEYYSEKTMVETLSSLFDENGDYYNLFILSFFYYF